MNEEERVLLEIPESLLVRFMEKYEEERKQYGIDILKNIRNENSLVSQHIWKRSFELDCEEKDATVYLTAATMTFELLRLTYEESGKRLPVVSYDTLCSFIEEFERDGDYEQRLSEIVQLENSLLTRLFPAVVDEAYLPEVTSKDMLLVGIAVNGMREVYGLLRKQKESENLEKKFSLEEE